MKLKYSFLSSILATMVLSACVSEEFDSKSAADTGKMKLNVSMLEPQTTRATTQVYNFPVSVLDAEGNVVNSYERADAVPAEVVLSVGSYTVMSHTPGEIEKRMTRPYYMGSADMEITKDITTDVNVICKMANSQVVLHYDADFLALFTEWSITLDDGSETALSFTSDDGNAPSIYWWFEDPAESLTLQFSGRTTAGNTVTATRTLSKNDAALIRYDDDEDAFTGGDIITINFTPVESTSGNLTDISINADVTFTDNDEKVIPVDVTDAKLPDDGGNDNPGGGDEPSGDAITLTLPAPLTFTQGEGGSLDKSLGDVTINATNGIQSLLVTAESDNPDMVESLIAVGAGYGLDFINAPGVEVVDNQDLVSFFSGLGQSLSVPTVGDDEYKFPIGNFFVLLDVMTGTHKFHLTVKDVSGNIKSGTVTITVNE